jgi:tetratricopeptide (TPR) repeat protein
MSSQKTVKIDYTSKSWNKKSNEIEQATVLIYDSESKKFVKVQLVETAVNSAKFVGYYSVSFSEKDIRPELYFPPQTLVQSSESLKKIETMISEGTLLKKPFFIRDDGGTANAITVFDSREQALEAFEKYRQARLQATSPVGKAALEAQALSKKAAEERARLELEAKMLSERQRLLEEEKKKQEQALKEQAEMAEAEKKARREKAAQLANEGMVLYQKEDFKNAAANFREATELDPSNNSFYFQYGVCHYRMDNFDKSIAMLNLSQPTGSTAIEKDFFLGLNFMKLKEFNEAAKSFEKVKNTNDKLLGAPAAFYLGVLQYQNEDYENAKSSFEYVLDESSDPEMDKQAETYIEQIANILAFKKEQQRRFILTLNGGLSYDSNILAIAKSQLNQQTELAGYRWSYGLSLESRLIYEIERELSATLTLSDLYSTNKNFSAEKSFQDTDPLSASIYFPFKYKGKAFEKGYQMTLSPGYETTMMNADASGSRETILNATVLKNDHTFVMDETWFATYSIEFRQDVSKIDSSAGTDDDLSASKWTLGTTQTFFQNQKKTEAWIGELSYANTTAKGDNNTNSKIEFAATYMAPLASDMVWTARLGHFYADYNKHTTGRKDSASTLSLALKKPWSEQLSSSLSLTYTNNGSTRDASDYSKYLIMGGLSWTTDL